MTYTQIASAAHLAGGQTQTEACASMTDAVLRRGSNAWRRNMLLDLDREAGACVTIEEYRLVRAQIVRVRSFL